MVENSGFLTLIQQGKHVFSSLTHSFPRIGYTYIDKLEIQPALRVRTVDGAETFPGCVFIQFESDTRSDARGNIRKYITNKFGATNPERDDSYWFTIFPQNGVITHKFVQDVLTALHEVNAIDKDQVSDALKTFGIQQATSEPSVPKSKLHVPAPAPRNT